MYYVKKCPICNSELEHDDVDVNFRGNQNEISICNNCHIAFEFLIRYGHLWKYTKSMLTYNSQLDDWIDYNDNVETVIVWKG